MKPTHLLLLCAIAIGSLSCNKNEKEPLSLLYVENHQIDLYYPSSEGGTISIKGGDGNYRAESSNPTIVTVEMPWSNTIRLTPLQLGDATVVVRDGSGEVYRLNIHIDYRKEIWTIDGVESVVTGAGLSEEEREAIRNEALATMPVKPGGGYELIYTEKEENSGTVLLYPETIGNPTREGRFSIEKDPDNHSFQYTFRFEGETHHFHIGPTGNRSVQALPLALIEEVTTRFTDRYPAVTQVITYQSLH